MRATGAPCIALIAGEASGDNLGAALIEALRARYPHARFVGVPGPRMQAAGCEALAASEELAVMGLFEILKELPRLWWLRRRLLRELRAIKPDVFVGIDAPEFNLRMASQLKAAGIPTVQYVSPQVWAWRQGRVRHIGQAVDRVLCVLPFETEFYSSHGVDARFVGHPLADQFALSPDRDAARASLGLKTQAGEQWVALLPGSRKGEASRLSSVFAATAALLTQQRPQLRFMAPLASLSTRELFESAWAAAAPGVEINIFAGRSREVLAAADVVLTASGTATLETLLCKRPMVVAYRMGALTAWVLERLGVVKVKYFAQPNLLAGRAVVPEYFQSAAQPAVLAQALGDWLDRSQAGGLQELEAEFLRIHQRLRAGGASAAAAVIAELLPADGAQAGEGSR
jgi:lipid-A-disaccharide synthase